MKTLYKECGKVLITMRLLKAVPVLLTTLLVACTTATGPVDIREAGQAHTVKSQTSTRDAGKPSPVDSTIQQRTQSMAVVRPAYPTASSQSPLKTRLLQQSEQHLVQKEWNNAIESAERGLRIDRKEALFYNVLAVAYSENGNRTQSVLFARQGLLYATKGTGTYDSLKQLSQ